MLRLAWLGSYLSHQASPRAKPPPALGDLSQLSAALHRHPYRLVHGGSRPPALGGLRRAANGRRHDAVPDGAARRRSRWSSSAPSTASSSRSAPFTSTGCCAPAPRGLWFEPPSAAVPNRPMSVADEGPLAAHALRRRRRIAMVMFWVSLLAISILLYRAARRIRSRRRHAVRPDAQRRRGEAPC